MARYKQMNNWDMKQYYKKDSCQNASDIRTLSDSVFLMRPSISIRGCVRPYVRPSVRPYVCPSVRPLPIQTSHFGRILLPARACFLCTLMAEKKIHDKNNMSCSPGLSFG